jgi:two-component system nitrate/nitrite response regulator NarL
VQDRRRLQFAPPHAPIDTLVLSQVRFLRDCLEAELARDPEVRVLRGCETISGALGATVGLEPCMVLLDGAFPDGPRVAAQLRGALPTAKIVAFALPEAEETVLRWAQAGISGYVPNTASLSELSLLLLRISRGEQFCSSQVTGALLRRIGDPAPAAPVPSGPPGPPSPGVALTGRERDILRLVSLGLPNKEIARRLDIGLGTTKTHVHNLLSKLKLSSRVQIAAQTNVTNGRALNRTLFSPLLDTIYTPAPPPSIPSAIPSD